MKRRLSLSRFIFVLGLISGLSFQGYAALVLTIPARHSWKETLKAQSYKPTDVAETPCEARDALEALPSLILKKLGGMGQISNVSFRGQTSRNTYVSIDDIPVQDGGGYVNFSPLLGGATRLTEVIPGSQGVRYGNGASGGVVLMETPFLPAENIFTAEGGSFQWGYGNLAHQKITPETQWVIHGEGSRTAPLPQYGNTRKPGERGRPRLGNMATRLEHQVGDTSTFKLTARVLETETKYDANTVTPLSPKPQEDQATTLALLGLGFETTTHAVKGFLNRSKLKPTSFPASFFLMSGASYTGTYTLSPRLESTLLAGVQQDRMNSGSPPLKKSLLSAYGGWIQKAHLTETLSAEAGIRLDHHQKFGGNTTYSAVLAYARGNTLVKGGIRTGFLNPALFDLYVTNTYVQGNPLLRSERTRTLDMTFEQTFPHQNMSFQLTPFLTQITNMIQGNLQNNVRRSVNLPGSTKISGVESQFLYVPYPTVSTTMSYTYTNLDAHQANTNPEFPKHKACFQLDYGPTEDVTLSPEILYIGKRQSTQGQGLREYSLVNIALKYQLNPGASLFARLDNAFNTRYAQTYNYQTPGRAIYVGTHLYF